MTVRNFALVAAGFVASELLNVLFRWRRRRMLLELEHFRAIDRMLSSHMEPPNVVRLRSYRQ